MKRSYFILFLLISLISELLIGQIPVGYKFDVNGQPIEGIVDQLTYEPTKELIHTNDLDAFEKGYYYGLNGTKIEGFIKYENKKFWFKKERKEEKVKITPSVIKSFVIGVDSFFVSSDFRFKNREITNPEYMQFVAVFDTNVFAIYYHFKSPVTSNVTFDKYLMYQAQGDKSWRSISRKRSTFLDMFSSYFDEPFVHYFLSKLYPFQKYSINLPFDSFFTLIKTAEYNYRFQHGLPIYFDKYWEETRDKNMASYKALITNKSDSSWTLVYYNDSMIFAQIDYVSFYPNNKNGIARAYYPNGKLRQETIYDYGHPHRISTFSDRGVLQRSYRIDSMNTKYKGTRELKITYDAVVDSTGANLIDLHDEFQISFYDSIAQRRYTQFFKNKHLIESYSFVEGQKVYQITNPNSHLKINALKNAFSSFMTENNYDRAMSDNAQGKILVSRRTDPKGYVIDMNIHNKLQPELNALVMNFCKIKLSSGAEYRTKFKAWKIGKEKVSFEVLVPFEFGINRFYRKPIYYNNYYNMFWMNNFMMQTPQPNINFGH